MLCRNLVSRTSEVVGSDGSNLLVCSVVKEEELVAASDADIRASIRRLESLKTSPDFKRWQQAIGFTYQQLRLLNDAALEDVVKPASQYCHDWMHGIFAGGVFNVITFLLFEAVHAALPRLKVWSLFHAYLMAHTWPKASKFDAQRADHFRANRIKAYKKAGSVKCPASDGLSILPVLCRFVLAVVMPSGVCLAACQAVIALADLVDAMQAIPLGLTTPARLRIATRALLSACIAAGWDDRMMPKFHWTLHYP